MKSILSLLRLAEQSLNKDYCNTAPPLYYLGAFVCSVGQAIFIIIYSYI